MVKEELAEGRERRRREATTQQGVESLHDLPWIIKCTNILLEGFFLIAKLHVPETVPVNFVQKSRLSHTRQSHSKHTSSPAQNASKPSHSRKEHFQPQQEDGLLCAARQPSPSVSNAALSRRGLVCCSHRQYLVWQVSSWKPRRHGPQASLRQGHGDGLDLQSPTSSIRDASIRSSIPVPWALLGHHLSRSSTQINEAS